MSRHHQGPSAPGGSFYPDDLEAGTRRRHQSRPAYSDYGDPVSNRHQHAKIPDRNRFESPSPSRHQSRRARAFSPPPRAYSPPPRRAYSPPSSRSHQARAHSPSPRAYSPPPRTRTYSPPRRRYGEETDPRNARESRGRRAHSRDDNSHHQDDRDHRHSRSHPPPRYHSPPSRRYHESPPPRRSASSRPRDDRHRSVPPRSGGGGRNKRSSSVGSPILAAGLRTAIQAGAATAYKMRNDPSPWMGEKGTKVATAAIGAAIVDTFMNQRHPKKVGGVRHQAIRQATEMALGKGVVKPAVQARKRH